ncbi:hypothetical protein LINPERPRIM_LOCUS9847 [Linum perenne]
MADKNGSIVATGKDQAESMETNKGPFSFLTNFNFPNPFDKRPDTPPPSTQLPKPDVVGETVKESQPPKPTVVRFPNPPSVVPPPIEAEAEVTSGKTHNPVVIWQVYAIGGFMILKWVWARWNERKERAKKGSSSSSSNDADNRSPEFLSPTEGDD